ncbi:MAG TPA: hypothetical protein VFM64_00155 [Candidatus Nitrosotenuis sp.]|nr:hypothetical protein [Candidatus Nitrosotenuis sp.]
MSQIVTHKPKNYVLYSELNFPKQRIHLKSTAKEAICQYCKSEIREGNGLVAKRIGGKLVLVCGHHKF